ncbi:CbbQ/NirQ/NorQ/GpvN family protein [Phytohabitans sp. ZYX-F-186]|uniref:CbbQ/NirQ/NorQ/GpvN family protein n=1 Tax=Phytohabitans maris TaxID=3071409 RepID=A0ABU0ZKJ3_9ACTN|nr:CbbQ/NirQ/NorQ/GpvN family protein [Phytohabitans sp. ZYX-F-186]MDQ7907560.1 CbbQ/NirQ/NorQ/GpvN family protein [Phytohabitans sp. ZYX-F-186]
MADEVATFTAAYQSRLPVLLKGPTGSGKTRFLEYMSYRLGAAQPLPLVTIACNDELSSSDLVGRYLLTGQGSQWIDGPLTAAVTHGGICYLDEVVEARKDTVVILHSLTDHRRLLPIAKLGVVLEAHPDFQLVASYNPRYQSSIKNLKHSTQQRFVAIEFDYPDTGREAEIIRVESGVDGETADRFAELGAKIRNLSLNNVIEGPSTRLLIYAARMVATGVPLGQACEAAITLSVTDDRGTAAGIREIIDAVMGG